MKNFVWKVVKFYGIALVISLLACWGVTLGAYEALDLIGIPKIGGSIWFQAGLATVEFISSMLAVERIRRIMVPLDEEDEVFNIEGL